MCPRISTDCIIGLILLGRNDTQLEEVIRFAYYANISDAQMSQLLDVYPNDPAKGAPYGTGDLYVLTPMYKRLASIAGDAGVDAVRRLFTRTFAANGQDVWAYRESIHVISRRSGSLNFPFQTLQATHAIEMTSQRSVRYVDHHFPEFRNTRLIVSAQPVFQTHGSEIPNMYGGGDVGDLFIHFANTLNPNGGPTQKLPWPKYRTSAPTLLEFVGNTSLQLTEDTYREDGIGFLMELNLNNTWPY